MAELQELLTDHLRDLYDAEKQLTKALPKLAKAASNQELKQAFTQHLEVTKNQVTRIEEAFEHLGEKAKSKPCKGMKGLVEEGQEHIGEHERGPMLDVALAAAAEKVEHYEIAAYLSARSVAKSIGQRAVAGLLQETLREEEQTGNLLLQIAERLQREAQSTAAEGAQETRRGQRGTKAGDASRSSRPASAQARSTGREAGSMVTTDHKKIRRWAEERGAKPACVRGTGGRGDTGLIRLDFPGYSGSESLQEISWDDWFNKFDKQGLALLHQERTSGGQKSNFNKLISRSGGSGRAAANSRAGSSRRSWRGR
jgi:ferritin-like metal-binding protein YciE